MIHYHGTPITPQAVLYSLAGRHFCVSHAAPSQVRHCHAIGQSVMLDNGAYSVWRRGLKPDWDAYYAWTDRWLDCPTTWAVIPDVIDGGAADQEELLLQWPHGARGAPVWHMHEPILRLLHLADHWPRVCIGSSAEYEVVLSPAWERRMDQAWNAIVSHHRRLPWVHMLRGMQCSGQRWPFASVDSTDIARNHHLPQKGAAAMAARWDSIQTPMAWTKRPEQMELVPCGNP